jgi:tetratricopeptide (TPR) repeat protein
MTAKLKTRLSAQSTKVSSDAADHKRFVQYPLTQPLPAHALKTTNCDLFLRNLESRLKSLKTIYDRDPKQPKSLVGYAATLYARAQLYSDLEGIAQVASLIDHIDQALRIHPKHDKLHMLRAQVAMTLHQLPRASQELDWLEANLSPQSRLRREMRSTRRELDLQRGARLEQHLKEMERGYQRADYQGYLLAARARELRGQVSLAQRYYGQAERRFRDVAPIPLAWLNVQRGLMAMHSGDFKAARTFFRAGYERCPRYPMAAEHLAEIEGRLGDLKRASELYETVVKQTQHPEFMAALAEIYLERGMKAESRDLVRRADERFRALNALIPEAVSGHAADFYLGLGASPEYALKLLKRDHQLRPNTHTRQALADALIERGELKEASRLVALTLKSPVHFAEKYWTATRLALAQKRTQEARQYKKRALSLNPKITELEGDLPHEIESSPSQVSPKP